MKKEVKKQLVRYCILSIISMVGISCYILADTYFVSVGIGATGLAALNLAIPIYSLIHGMGLMLGSGGGIRYAIQENEKQKNQIFSLSVKVGFVISSLLMLLSFFGVDQIVYFLGADEVTFALTKIYVKVLLLLSPLFIFNDIILGFLRNDNAPAVAMKSMLYASFFNIVMDYILIFVFDLGMFGAVLATGLAPLVSLGGALPHFKAQRHHFHWLFSTKLNHDIWYILSSGLPAFISEFSSGIIIIFFNLVILNISHIAAVVAYGVVANLALVMTSVFNGLAMGMQPLVSEAFGRKEKARIQYIYRLSTIATIVIGVIMMIVIYVFSEPLALVFNHEHDMEMQKLAVKGLQLYFLASPMCGFNILGITYLAATMCDKSSQLLSALRGGVLLLPILWLLSYFLGLTGVWLSLSVSETGVMLLAIAMLYKANKKSA